MIKQKRGGVLIFIVLIILILVALAAVFLLSGSESALKDDTSDSENVDNSQSAENLIDDSIISEEGDVELGELV